ncbi:MAG: glycosyltransferase, partial [Blastochloris sp.]|nr:glycosyltransferase [Blastochloris sp.]
LQTISEAEELVGGAIRHRYGSIRTESAVREGIRQVLPAASWACRPAQGPGPVRAGHPASRQPQHQAPHLHRGQKNKPNGLNRGLKIANGDVVCIFDAEDSPHPDIYQIINTKMVRDGADVVQSGVQLMNFESNWFSALNCLEYFFWFKSGLHAFTNEFNVTPLGGNTVFFKRDWLQKIDGWDADLLTEDADVGIRLTLLGANIQIVYSAEHATQEETPDTATSFIKQRTRWCQGFYEIFFKGDWLRLPLLKQKVTALYILLNSVLQAFMILYLPIGVYIALTQQVAVPIALLSYAAHLHAAAANGHQPDRHPRVHRRLRQTAAARLPPAHDPVLLSLPAHALLLRPARHVALRPAPECLGEDRSCQPAPSACHPGGVTDRRRLPSTDPHPVCRRRGSVRAADARPFRPFPAGCPADPVRRGAGAEYVPLPLLSGCRGDGHVQRLGERHTGSALALHLRL